jgi:CheY-like chemotaxis protein
MEKLINEDRKIENIKSQYQLIYNNANKLLSLINQLLDLSSIDAGKMKLEVERDDIVTFIKGITASFQLISEIKKIDLAFSTSLEKMEIYFDKDKIEKIITNLLSNAFKFTNAGGRVAVAVDKPEEETILISVEDTGTGISQDEIKKIFNRFYKAETPSYSEGTGIGLALVKELVELHFGTISVHSKLNKGTKFIIKLPLNKELYKASIIKKEKKQSSVKPSELKLDIDEDTVYEKQSDLPSILIIEDNEDLLKFVKDSIVSKYTAATASNGKEGLEKAYEIIPDLIISDVKMPGMDGIELCRTIKTDERTSHIPVILLTARSSIENKIEGLETGADDYITKPFQIAELMIRVNNLIEQREKLRKRFRQEIVLEPKEIAVTSADEKFLNRILGILEEHCGDENFSVDEFAKETGLSRMQLHRKLQALTDQSASEFIRNFRLKRAVKLLSGNLGNISEIAYEVGFSNPSYFAECFKNLFGFSPSEYHTNSNKIQ